MVYNSKKLQAKFLSIENLLNKVWRIYIINTVIKRSKLFRYLYEIISKVNEKGKCRTLYIMLHPV